MIRFIGRAAESMYGTVFQIPWTYFDKKQSGRHRDAQLQNIGFKTVAMALRNDSVEMDDPELKGRKTGDHSRNRR